MVRSVNDLLEKAAGSAALNALLEVGDWYLVGSRSSGLSDDLSDWDTVLLVASDAAVVDLDRGLTDPAFGVVRPAWTGEATLEFDRGWRAAGGVDIEVLGPSSREEREAEWLSEWTYTMAHATPLRVSTDLGERYRQGLVNRFEQERRRLQNHAYLQFRHSRNEAAAMLGRSDWHAQVVTSALCAADAGRFLLLTTGQPFPASKWLLAEVDRAYVDGEVGSVLRALLDCMKSAAERFATLWELWEIIDHKALSASVDREHLDGSPFLAGQTARNDVEPHPVE